MVSELGTQIASWIFTDDEDVEVGEWFSQEVGNVREVPGPVHQGYRFRPRSFYDHIISILTPLHLLLSYRSISD
jgi:hypothetical protein